MKNLKKNLSVLVACSMFAFNSSANDQNDLNKSVDISEDSIGKIISLPRQRRNKNSVIQIIKEKPVASVVTGGGLLLLSGLFYSHFCKKEQGKHLIEMSNGRRIKVNEETYEIYRELNKIIKKNQIKVEKKEKLEKQKNDLEKNGYVFVSEGIFAKDNKQYKLHNWRNSNRLALWAKILEKNDCPHSISKIAYISEDKTFCLTEKFDNSNWDEKLKNQNKEFKEKYVLVILKQLFESHKWMSDNGCYYYSSLSLKTKETEFSTDDEHNPLLVIDVDDNCAKICKKKFDFQSLGYKFFYSPDFVDFLVTLYKTIFEIEEKDCNWEIYKSLDCDWEIYKSLFEEFSGGDSPKKFKSYDEIINKINEELSKEKYQKIKFADLLKE